MAAKTLLIGDSTSSNHQISFDIGGSNPTIRWNTSTGAIEMSADGVSFAGISAGSTRLKNNVGGGLVLGDLIYISSYDSGSGYYQMKKAVVTEGNSTTLYAQYVVTETIADTAVGTVAQKLTLTGLDTSGGTVGRPVFLSTVAGSWTVTAPAPENRIQLIGRIIEVHATTGRIAIDLPGQVLYWADEDF